MCKLGSLWHTAAVSAISPTTPNRPRQQVRWRSLPQMQLLQPESPAPDWLLDEGSLTERLIGASGGHFQVQRLSQKWCRPLFSESVFLDLAPDQWALVREVALRCFDQTWVYARSVMPAETLVGSLRRLRRLQNESLGALLFKHPHLSRDAFEVALLPAGSDYIHPSVTQDSPSWARRSCFSLHGRRLLVSEVFLDRFQA